MSILIKYKLLLIALGASLVLNAVLLAVIIRMAYGI